MWTRRYWILAAAAALAACGSTPPQQAQPAANRVVAARYVGVLPCADCRGVRADLLLYTEPGGAPAGYELIQTYFGTRDGDRSLTGSGAWNSGRGAAQDPQSLVIQLDPGQPGRTRSFRQVGPRVLRALDVNLADLPAHVPRSLLRVPDNLPTSATVLTQGDAAQPVDVPSGQPVVLMLASQPGAGYGWNVVSGPPPQLAPAGDPVHVPDANGTGYDLFRYQADQPGTYTLRLAYRAQSGPAAPVAELTFRLNVR